MGNEEFNKDFERRRKEYLTTKISSELKNLDIKELENINFIIEKRKHFVGFDSIGREIYSYPQPGPNYPGSPSANEGYPPNPYTMRP